MLRWKKSLFGVGCFLAASAAHAQSPPAAPIIQIPVVEVSRPTTLPNVGASVVPLVKPSVEPSTKPDVDIPEVPTLNVPPPPSFTADLSIPPMIEGTSHPAGPCGAVETLCKPRQAVGPHDRFYANFEYLYWVTQGVHVVPLLTTAANPAAGTAGALGDPSTRILFGGDRMLNGFRSGFRVEAGTWLDDRESLGVSGRFFFLGRQGEGLAGGSDGSQLLAIPLILQAPGQLPGPALYPAPAPALTPLNLPPGTALLPPVGVPLQRALYVGLPGAIQGTVDVNTSTDFLGGNLDIRHCMTHTECGRLEFFGGYRYLFLGDSLNQSFDAAFLNPSSPNASRVMGYDSWRTRNYFHGAEFGMHVTRNHGPLSATLETSLALGVTASNLDANQTRTLGNSDAQIPIYQVGGHDNSTFFSVVPEVTMKLGWQACESTRLTFGYNFLYWSRVRRAQEQYDLTAVTPNDPTDFWAQGWSLGAEVRY